MLKPKLYKSIFFIAITILSQASAQNEITPLLLDQINHDSLNTAIQSAEIKKDYQALGAIYSGIYTYYSESAHRDSATIYGIKAEEYAYKAGDSAKYYFTEIKLGEFAADAHNFSVARSYYYKALNYYQRLKDYKMLFHAYGGIARVYELQNDSLTSNKYNALAAEANKKSRDALAEVIINDFTIRKLINSNKPDESILLLKKNLRLINNSHTFGNGEQVRNIRRRLDLNSLAECYNLKKDYRTAITYLKQELPYDKEMDFNDLNINRYSLLAVSYININEKDSALKYIGAFFQKTKNTIDNLSPEKLNEISAKYEAEKKQRQIDQLQLQNHLQQLTVATQRKLNIAFISILILAFVAAYFIIKNVQHKRKLQLNIERQRSYIAKEQAVETERYRISSELHDDLGSGLSTIRLLSEMMKANTAGNIENQLGKISDSSKELVQKMNEIVWALNINNDNLQSLLAYIRQYTVRELDDVNINCSVSMPSHIPNVSIPGKERRHIFLMVKECINNIIKHSKASQVNIEISLNEDFCLQIHDNGIGIPDKENEIHHFGLNNLKQRANELDGNIKWHQNNGTIVQIQIPLKTLSHKSVS